MKTHGGCGCKGAHVYTATALGKCRVASPTLGRLYPGTHIIVGWVDPRSSLDTKEWRKSPTLRHPGSNPGRRARSQSLAAWATWPLKKTMTWIQSPLSHLKELYNYIHCNVCKTTMPATLFVSKKGSASLSSKSFINIRVESCNFALHLDLTGLLPHSPHPCSQYEI